MRPSRTGGSIQFTAAAVTPPSAPTLAESPPGSGHMVATNTAGGTVTYSFYWSNVSGGPYSSVYPGHGGAPQPQSSNTFIDEAYDTYYVATVTKGGVESAYSNEVQATD